LFLAQGRREVRFGLAALREFLLSLPVELGVLNRNGGMCGKPHEDLFVPVCEGVRREVGDVQYPLDPHADEDRHRQHSHMPSYPGPCQILFAEARIGSIVVRAPGTRGVEHLPTQPLAWLNAEPLKGYKGSANLIAADQDV